jgi:TolB-like protein/Tfp pilus assembly protein PilF
MSVSSRAVFLSYASQDAEAARRICEALRAAGIEVWLDQSELRGGDSWDRQIRKQIHECALFIPIISATTQARLEGYFRREWKLAVDRTHDMADGKPFLLPVVIDVTNEQEAEVPESFRGVQWTRLPEGGTPPAFVERVLRLLRPGRFEESPRAQPSVTPVPGIVIPRKNVARASWPSPRAMLLIAVVAVIGGGYFATDRLTLFKRSMDGGRTWTHPTQSAAPAQIQIPQKSIAVLPFTDLSEKKDQEYFADGLSEELIDLLTKVQGLTVPARTSSFYFKGKTEDIPTIARRLMVAHVLEGSVRKYGAHLRVTVQLVRADNGYHLWSETYDRELNDLFEVQDDIAGSVVKALRVSILSPDMPRSVPTASSEAHTLYLHALSLTRQSAYEGLLQAYADLRHALRLDPSFALAWAALAELLTDDTAGWNIEVDGQLSREQSPVPTLARTRQVANDAADHALQLEPRLAEAHLAKALVLYWMDWNWDAAQRELEKARELDSANAAVTAAAGALAITTGRFEEGLKLASLAATQDPLGTAYWDIGAAQHRLGNLNDAAASYQHLIELYPTASSYHFRHALVLLSKHDAMAALEEMGRENNTAYKQVGLPLALDAVGRGNEADHALASAEQTWGTSMAYQISYVYAARNDVDHTISWLERAYEQHDSGLLSVKHDPMLKNVEADLRFKSLLRKMNLQN